MDLYRVDGGQTSWFTARRGACAAGSSSRFTFTCAHAPLQAQNLSSRLEPARRSSEPRRVARPRTPLHGNQQRTRFLIGLPKATKFEVFSLTNPNRVVVEVDGDQAAPARAAQGGAGRPHQVVPAPASPAPSTSRVIIYVTEPVIVSSAQIEKTKDGQRPAPGRRDRARSCPSPPASTRAGRQQEGRHGAAAVRAGRRRTAAAAAASCRVAGRAGAASLQAGHRHRPGHGGHDSGAEKNGAVEKDIVLAFGKILADKLKATGRFKVLMTRDTDVFIPLGERVAFARAQQGQPVHRRALRLRRHRLGRPTAPRSIRCATSSPTACAARRKRRVSSNVLSQNEVEKVKQASDGDDVDLVKGILADLAEREVDATHDRTSVFARTVIETMGASTAMRNEPDQQAGVPRAQDGAVPLGADRARLRHQQAGCREPAVGRLARQGLGLDPDRDRQLLHQSDGAAADVTRCGRARENKKGRSRRTGLVFCGQLGSHPRAG